LTAAAPPASLGGGSQLQVNFPASVRRPEEKIPMSQTSSPGRTRVERGIYRQPNGKYALCARRAGVLRFRTAGYDLAAARRLRVGLIAALRTGRVPASPRLRLRHRRRLVA
jgi:hypothetical protein